MLLQLCPLRTLRRPGPGLCPLWPAVLPGLRCLHLRPPPRLSGLPAPGAERSTGRAATPHSLVPRNTAPRWVHTSASAWAVESPRKPTTGDGPLQTDPTQTQPQRGPPEPEPEPDPLQDQSMGLVQRFKRTLKQYGKVLVPVHLLTSTLWVGTFYYAAMKGVNIVPFLEVVGFPQRLIDLLQNSQGGSALTAYAMYKITTPARYTVTLGGTSLCVGYLRRHGYMSTPPPVKDYLQGRMEETRGRLTERMEETKERLSERLQETKDKVTFRKKPE